MARLARVTRVNQPYHVTHRGNRRGPVFFSDEDRAAYLADLAVCAGEAGLDIWGYCLMTNHIHLLAVARRPDSLARAMRRAQQRHARRINRAQGWQGHLWANRFYSTPLDEAHLWTAIKYIELNPVRAGLVARAPDYAWSSARAHAGRVEAAAVLAPGRPFGGTRPHPLTGRPMSWAAWLARGLSEEDTARLREATSTGRPCGSDAFVAALEEELGRPLVARRRGRKPRTSPACGPRGKEEEDHNEIPGLFDP